MFKIFFHKSAEKKFLKLDKITKKRTARALETISSQPYLGKSLSGELSGNRRVRIGDFRLIYEIIEKDKIILIHAIGSRGDIYK